MAGVITHHLGYRKYVELRHEIDTILDLPDRLEYLIKQELTIPSYMGPLDETTVTIQQADIKLLVQKLVSDYHLAAAQYECLIEEAENA
jgi:hypothetical protein